MCGETLDVGAGGYVVFGAGEGFASISLFCGAFGDMGAPYTVSAIYVAGSVSVAVAAGLDVLVAATPGFGYVFRV